MRWRRQRGDCGVDAPRSTCDCWERLRSSICATDLATRCATLAELFARRLVAHCLRALVKRARRVGSRYTPAVLALLGRVALRLELIPTAGRFFPRAFGVCLSVPCPSFGLGRPRPSPPPSPPQPRRTRNPKVSGRPLRARRGVGRVGDRAEAASDDVERCARAKLIADGN